MTLYGTPRSHFARIVRIVAAQLETDLDWVDVGNVGAPEPFGGNPLMRVPVLVDGERALYDSHDICVYLTEQAGVDPLRILQPGWEDRNRLTVIRGVMDAEVRLLLAERAGMATEGAVFDKARATIAQGVAWLEEQLDHDAALDYRWVAAVAMWDHLVACGNAVDAPQIAATAARLTTAHPALARTGPGVPVGG